MKFEFEDPLIIELQRLLKQHAVNGTIMMTYLSKGYLSFFFSFISNIRLAGITNIIVCAMDDETIVAAKKLQVPYMNCVEYAKHFEKKTGIYRAVNLVKPFVGLRILELGYSVLFTGVDLMYLRNPFYMLRGDVDVEASGDVWMPRAEFSQSYDPHTFEGASINCDFYIVYNTPRSILLFEEFFSASLADPGYSDQERFIEIVNRNLGKKYVYDEVQRKEMMYQYGYGFELSLRVLPYCDVTMGGPYTHGYCNNPAVIHFTGVGKVWSAVETGLFELSPEYYAGTYISQPYEETKGKSLKELVQNMLATIQIAREGGWKVFLRPFPCELHVERERLDRERCTFDFFFNGDRVEQVFRVVRPWGAQYAGSIRQKALYNGVYHVRFVWREEMNHPDTQELRFRESTDGRWTWDIVHGNTLTLEKVTQALHRILESTKGSHLILHDFPVWYYSGSEDAEKQQAFDKLVYLNLQPAWCFFGHDWEKYEKAGWAIPGHVYPADSGIRY